jgi:hypothetical protein
MKDFKFHYFIKWQQQRGFDESRFNSSPWLVVAQVDFTENYNCIVQDEIAAFHFKGTDQVGVG